MTRLPSSHPHQVVTDWIAANDDHAHVPTLSIVRTPRTITQIDGPSPFDYDVATRRARKMQAEAVAAAARTISKLIGHALSSTARSFRDYLRTRREIQRLSYLTPRVLDDLGIPSEFQARALEAHRQLSLNRFHPHL